MQDFSYADYVKLCQRFGIIVIESIRQISEDKTNIIIIKVNAAIYYKEAF